MVSIVWFIMQKRTDVNEDACLSGVQNCPHVVCGVNVGLTAPLTNFHTPNPGALVHLAFAKVDRMIFMRERWNPKGSQPSTGCICCNKLMNNQIKILRRSGTAKIKYKLHSV